MYSQQADSFLLQSLVPVLLLVADPRLAIDDVRVLVGITLRLLDVRRWRDITAAGQLLDVGLELADVLADDLGVLRRCRPCP